MNELYQALASNSPVQQNPREQCMNLLRQNGIQIPQGMENNPQGILQHLMQSDRVPQGRLNMAQQMLSRMFHR